MSKRSIDEVGPDSASEGPVSVNTKKKRTMSEETKKRATGGNIASSGNGPGGRGTMGNHDGQRSGIPELGSLQFKSKTKDQADMYFKTRDALAEYVGRQLSYEMLLLVSTGHETVYTKPTPPAIPATRSATPQGDTGEVVSPVATMRMEDFKMELGHQLLQEIRNGVGGY